MRTRGRGAVSAAVAGMAAMVLLAGAGCTAGDDDSADGGSGSGSGSGSSDGGGGGATATGVTADTVKLGVAGVDPAQLEALGIEADGPTSEALNTAWVDAQNAQGGVAGRQIEMVFRPFLPTGEAEAEAACVELTEDQQVFLVTGIFLDDTPLCFTEAHDTPYLGQFGHSAERDRRSNAPFVALEMSDERQRLAGIDVFLDEGALDGKVALYWDVPDTAVVDEFVRPALEEAGVDVVVETTLEDFGGDQAAQDQALDTMVERIRAASPDVVLNVSGFLPPLEAFQRNGWLPERVLSTSAQALVADVLTSGGLTADTLERVTVAAPYAPTRDELVEDPEVQRCVDEYNASDPELPIDLDATTGDQLDAIANECAAFRLFVLAAEAAGDDLTPESWGAAAESLGEVDLPGMPYASLGEGKHSAGDAIGRYEYDPDEARMVATGPPIAAPG
jgi:ABC-type branched-subunit amino acid transport system substrate-binding protein